MTEARLVCLRQRSGQRQKCVTAIIGPAGRKFTYVVWISAPVRLHRLANDDVNAHSRELPKPSVKGAARRMLQAGKSLGITKAAKRFLRKVTTS